MKATRIMSQVGYKAALFYNAYLKMDVALPVIAMVSQVRLGLLVSELIGACLDLPRRITRSQ